MGSRRGITCVMQAQVHTLPIHDKDQHHKGKQHSHSSSHHLSANCYMAFENCSSNGFQKRSNDSIHYFHPRTLIGSELIISYLPSSVAGCHSPPEEMAVKIMLFEQNIDTPKLHLPRMDPANPSWTFPQMTNVSCLYLMQSWRMNMVSLRTIPCLDCCCYSWRAMCVSWEQLDDVWILVEVPFCSYRSQTRLILCRIKALCDTRTAVVTCNWKGFLIRWQFMDATTVTTIIPATTNNTT